MKFNGNVVLTAALVATLSAMVACAPAKRGAKFADRSGKNSTGNPAEKASGVRTMNTPEANELRDQIVSIDAAIQESNESEESQEQIDKLLEEYTAKGVSSLDPVKEEVQATEEEQSSEDNDQVGAVGGKAVTSSDRPKYIMSVRVNIANIGYLDLVGVSAKFGKATMLRTLTHVNKECATKYADLKIKAICTDKSCSQLLVQFNETARGSQAIHIEEVLNRKEVKDGELKVIKFSEVSRVEELEAKGVKVQKTVAVCKANEETSDESTLTATEKAAEAKAKEEAAVAKAKEEEDKKKKSDDSEEDVIAKLGE